MDGKNIVRNLCAFLLLCGLLYGITTISPTVRAYIYTTFTIPDASNESVKRTMTKQWEKELQGATKQIESAVMSMKVSDIITYVGRTQKMMKDVQSMSTFVKQEVEKYTKQYQANETVKKNS